MERSAEKNLVVLVDDDEGIREAFADVLETEGYEVLRFGNGLEAIEGLEHLLGPCLILLDWMMPKMNGQQFLDARAGILLDSPVVVVSAVARTIKAANQGVAELVEKPIDIDVLLNLVRRHCPKSA
jgi:DNA-binding NtrC family response regulator